MNSLDRQPRTTETNVREQVFIIIFMFFYEEKNKLPFGKILSINVPDIEQAHWTLLASKRPSVSGAMQEICSICSRSNVGSELVTIDEYLSYVTQAKQTLQWVINQLN